MPEAKDNDKQEKKRKVDTIYFKLGEKQAVWKTNDGKINLNRFSGNISGKVTSDDSVSFKQVRIAMFHGELIQIDKEDTSKPVKQEIVDVTNLAENNAKLRKEAIEYLKKLTKEDVIDRIKSISNPYLVAQMIELETAGKNKSKRRREGVVTVLKEKLEELNKKMKSGIVSYNEQSTEGYKVSKEDADTF